MSGAESYVGGFIAVALVRELAPGFAALAIGARAGTAIVRKSLICVLRNRSMQ